MNGRIHISKGLDIPVAGGPEQVVFEGPPVRHVALSGLDYPGIRPRVLVTPGDRVELGQPLFLDKRDPELPYASPGRGTVVAVNRGVRRVLQTIVVHLEEDDSGDPGFEPLSDRQIHDLDRGSTVRRIQQSGLWPGFRTRPFNRVPHSASEPQAIFVTATDTRPLAAHPHAVIRPHSDAFFNGLKLVSKLTSGPVHLCIGPEWDIPLKGVDGVHVTVFSGPHPAGLAGTHIHHLYPVGAGRSVWHIGYQDVIGIGQLFGSGRIPTARVISLAGDDVIRPRLVSTRIGANTDELVRGQLNHPESCRVIAGSVLNGRTAAGSNAYLGRYHLQLSVIREDGNRKLFGWLNPFRQKYKAPSTFLSRIRHTEPVVFTSAQNGRFAAMLPLRIFETVMPLDILPSPLFRALMVRDTDQAQALGCLELAEEDLALCSFLCPAKYDYGAVLRLNLDQIEREG